MVCKTKKVSLKKALMSGVIAGGAIAVPAITVAAGIGKIDPNQIDYSAQYNIGDTVTIGDGDTPLTSSQVSERFGGGTWDYQSTDALINLINSSSDHTFVDFARSSWSSASTKPISIGGTATLQNRIENYAPGSSNVWCQCYIKNNLFYFICPYSVIGSGTISSETTIGMINNTDLLPQSTVQFKGSFQNPTAGCEINIQVRGGNYSTGQISCTFCKNASAGENFCTVNFFWPLKNPNFVKSLGAQPNSNNTWKKMT